MSRSRAAAAGALLLAAAMAVAACSRDRGAAPARPSPATHTVAIEGVAYAPPSLTVNAGDRIVFVNRDPFPHTATSPSAGFDSKEIAGDGGSWSYTVPRAGEVDYICTLHPTMKGVLHVR